MTRKRTKRTKRRKRKTRIFVVAVVVVVFDVSIADGASQYHHRPRPRHAANV